MCESLLPGGYSTYWQTSKKHTGLPLPHSCSNGPKHLTYDQFKGDVTLTYSYGIASIFIRQWHWNVHTNLSWWCSSHTVLNNDNGCNVNSKEDGELVSNHHPWPPVHVFFLSFSGWPEDVFCKNVIYTFPKYWVLIVACTVNRSTFNLTYKGVAF